MKKSVIAPIIVVGVGTGWLLNELDIFPVLDWLWSILLALAGILTLAFGGKNKLSLVIGPFLLIGCGFSVARQLGAIKLQYEIPALVITFGALWLIVEMLKLPAPDWIERTREPNQKSPQ